MNSLRTHVCIGTGSGEQLDEGAQIMSDAVKELKAAVAGCVCVCVCVVVQAGEAGESELYGVRESRVCVCVVCVRADRRGGGICAVWCKRVAGACVCVWWQGALQ